MLRDRDGVRLRAGAPLKAFGVAVRLFPGLFIGQAPLAVDPPIILHLSCKTVFAVKKSSTGFKPNDGGFVESGPDKPPEKKCYGDKENQGFSTAATAVWVFFRLHRRS